MEPPGALLFYMSVGHTGEPEYYVFSMEVINEIHD